MSYLKIKHTPEYKLIIFRSDVQNTKLTNIDVEQLLLMIENFLKNCGSNKFKFIQFFDITNVNIRVDIIVKLAKLYRKHGDIIENHCICSCLLFEKTALNDTFIKLFNKLYTPTRPLIISTDEEKVNNFMNENLKDTYDATFTVKDIV